MDQAPHLSRQMFLALPLNTVQLFSPLFLDWYLISSLFEIMEINVSVNDILIGLSLCNHFGKWVNHQRVTPGNIVGLCISCWTHAGNIDWKQIIFIVVLPNIFNSSRIEHRQKIFFLAPNSQIFARQQLRQVQFCCHDSVSLSQYLFVKKSSS